MRQEDYTLLFLVTVIEITFGNVYLLLASEPLISSLDRATMARADVS
jgi:hypothetical protein